MEYLIEFLLDLIIEGSIELLPNEKIPKWIRCILAFIIILFFLTITIGLIVIGTMVLKESILGGIFIIIVGVILLICSIVKFIKVKNKMNN